MNRAYRLVWSELHNTWIAVAEFARTRGKRASGVVTAAGMLALGAASAGAAAPAPNALPTGGQVTVGQAAISTSGPRMDVTQSTSSAIVNWDSFNIGSQAHVNFAQPSSSAVILNRVLGGGASSIYGRMTANGQVFLTNPQGILFASGAQVDVGGLVASSLGISDANFVAGKYSFEKVGAAGTVENQGSINIANGGFVALIAPQVSNSGTITATGGSIGLAAGDSVNLDFDHDGMLSFQVNLPAAAARADNTGVLVADGGRVVMNAQAKDALLSTVLNNEGVIRARSLETRNGEIWLGGGNSGVVSVTGTLDASNRLPPLPQGEGRGEGGVGGTVKVLGDKVGLFDHAKIDVSGVGAGGTALVGGNFQGKGPEQNASMTYVGKDVSINADAVGTGDGGKVIVWADDSTHAHGSISAKGGAQGGNGGFVETSAHFLDVAGIRVNAGTASGRAGNWLLDPTNIDVVLTGSADAALADVDAFATSDIAITTPATSSVDVALINAAGSLVTLQATNNIDFKTAVNIAGAGVGLTAQARNNIILTAGITTNNGAITLTANDASAPSGTGSITGAGALSSTGGAINLNAVTMTLPAIDAGGGLLTINNSGAASQSAAFSGSGGLTKTGVGSLTLSQLNNYTGTTNVNAGTLSVTNAAALNTASSVVVNGGTLDINNVTLNTLVSMQVQGTGQGGVG
ncbi:MAG: filamentous hemagglutinin N-terminal domain-containing protein, partial [Sulfuritalea sp.]|nr:filamentous hemagglutinin N-terminal domain-containing protein [Sulfuritalea sp.]